jgi:HlyD family secretion protein
MKVIKSIFRWLTLAVIVGLIGAAIYFSMQPKPIAVDVTAIARGPMIVTVNEDGRTRIRERYVVSAPLAGRMLRVEMDPGDIVLQGSTRLAAIRPRNPELLDSRERQQAEMRVKAREAVLVQTKPALARAKAELSYAKLDFDRLEELIPQRIASKDDLDKANMEVRVCEEDYRSAVYSQHIAKYELELARAALDWTQNSEDANFSDFEIFSPIHGRVLRVLQESATVVNPGTPLIEVGDPSDLEVVVDVLSSDAVKISGGTSVFLERWGGDEPLRGEVRLIEPSAFTKISALGVEEQRVNVIIDLVDPVEKRESLGDGFRVEARIVIWEQGDVVKISSGALFRDGDQWATFVLQDSRARLRHLIIGRHNDLEAQVVDGLSPGEQVILHPSDKIQDAARIAVR